MSTRITVTQSPTNGKSNDENDDAENATPIVCTSEEIPPSTSKVVSDRDDDGVGVRSAASGNERETDETEETEEEDEQPVKATATAEASASEATTEAAAASTTTTPETTSSENAPSNPPAFEADATAKNNAEVEEEKKDGEEVTKAEEIGAAAYKKVRKFMLALTAEQNRMRFVTTSYCDCNFWEWSS
jgi:hypothetical protein